MLDRQPEAKPSEPPHAIMTTQRGEGYHAPFARDRVKSPQPLHLRLRQRQTRYLDDETFAFEYRYPADLEFACRSDQVAESSPIKRVRCFGVRQKHCAAHLEPPGVCARDFVT